MLVGVMTQSSSGTRARLGSYLLRLLCALYSVLNCLMIVLCICITLPSFWVRTGAVPCRTVLWRRPAVCGAFAPG